MIDPKIKNAIAAALQAFAGYNSFDATQLTKTFNDAFALEDAFMSKVAKMDAVFDSNPQLEVLREVFFDLLMINFFSADVKKLEEDYLDSPEWEQIEEETLDRGTELLNVLLYLNECEDEHIEPELEDYLKEFLLVDEDEFQDEYRIYETVIANQILMDSPVEEIKKVADTVSDDSELKELFYPVMCFFQDTDPSAEAKAKIADNAVNKEFDMAVLGILQEFN
jgi:hypothetical protein